MMNEGGLTRRTIALGVAAYAAWLVQCAAGIGICIIWRQSLLVLYKAAGWNKYGASAYDYLIVTVFLLGWLILTIATEAWYRRGIENGTVGRRILRLTIIEIAVAAAGIFLGWLVVALA